MSAAEELFAILESVGARVTLDFDRSTAKPCNGCGRSDVPRDLVDVGTYVVDLRGGMRAGDPITRPMCAACEAMLPSSTEKT